MKGKVLRTILLVRPVRLLNILAQASHRVLQSNEIQKQEDFRQGKIFSSWWQNESLNVLETSIVLHNTLSGVRDTSESIRRGKLEYTRWGKKEKSRLTWENHSFRSFEEGLKCVLRMASTMAIVTGSAALRWGWNLHMAYTPWRLGEVERGIISEALMSSWSYRFL